MPYPAYHELLKTVAMFGITTRKTLWAITAIVLAAPRWALACAACSGRSDDMVVQGLNAAVLTLMGVLVVVLGTIVGSLAYVMRRASKHPLALPGVPEGGVR